MKNVNGSFFQLVGTVTSNSGSKISLAVKNNNGNGVSLEVITPKKLGSMALLGSQIGVIGEVRSRKGRENEEQNVVVELVAEGVFEADVETECNIAEFYGKLAKKKYILTRRGEPLCICVLVRERAGTDRPDAIPCIFKNANALGVCELPLGTGIEVLGKMRSRLVKGIRNPDSEWKVQEIFVNQFNF